MLPALTDVAELRERGLGRREIEAATASLTRLCVGTYASSAPATDEDEHVLRAHALARRLRSVAPSHLSAAIAHQLPVPREGLGTIHLSPLPGRAGKPKSGRGYRIHDRPLVHESLVTVGGLLTTHALTTVLDCARLLDDDWRVAIADSALRRGLITAEELCVAAGNVRGLRGAARARALPFRASGKAESPGESLARLRLRRLGFHPEEQVELSELPGRPRVDFLIDGWLVVEFDGQTKYAMAGDVGRAHWEEKQRHDRIVEAGYEILRIRWAELWDEAQLSERLERALRRARLRRRAAT